MFLRRIPKLNAKRYNCFFLGIQKQISNSNIIYLRDLYTGNFITSFNCLQTKYKKVIQCIHTPINKFLLPTNYYINSIQDDFCGYTHLINKNSIFWQNPSNLIQNTKINIIIGFKKLKILYTAGYGTYAVYLYSNLQKNQVTFKLPSGLLLLTDLWIITLVGANKYKNRQKQIPQFMKYKIRKQKKSVRGVAMNPIDHHNGGRANRKPLFLNKYNNIAKKNK